MVDSVMSIQRQYSQKDYALTPEVDAMQNFCTYLVRKNKNYRPKITDPEVLDCPTNVTHKGKKYIYASKYPLYIYRSL